MSEFLFLYRNGEKLSPEQMQQQMGRWMAWLKELGDRGVLKSAGHPLERSGKLVSGAKRTVTDGLFAEAKDVIGGYSIVEAATLDQAVELSHGCPIFNVGGGVEVRPIMKM
jgi:hypothetical protein